MALDAQEEDNNIMLIAEMFVQKLHYVSAVEFAERVEREVWTYNTRTIDVFSACFCLSYGKVL